MPTKLWYTIMQYVIKYELNLFALEQAFAFRIPNQPTDLALFITSQWSRETVVMSYTSWYPAPLIHI